MEKINFKEASKKINISYYSQELSEITKIDKVILRQLDYDILSKAYELSEKNGMVYRIKLAHLISGNLIALGYTVNFGALLNSCVELPF